VNQKITADRQRASKLLDANSGEVDGFFKLWPPDKNYFFSSDSKAFLAYDISYKTAICMGDAVGAGKSLGLLLDEFTSFCRQRHLAMAFIQTNTKHRQAYKLHGLKEILIGVDAVIDLKKFTSQTIKNKYFRNLVNRYEKQHYEFASYRPPHSLQLISELKSVSDSWLTLPHRKEWAFLTGRFENDYLQQTTLHVLRDIQGRAQAFVNELPSYQPGSATIDLMRHARGAPVNSMDLLFIRLLQSKYQEGYTHFNLGMSPLDGRPYAHTLGAKVLLLVYRLGDNFIGFKGLHKFKSKYATQWELRYVWYLGRA